ncbi:hypothetical protein C8R44DRAFT_873743 [Mycena epipterygia]|nr:hypothetical protein C8R44DRAFT_873743 [Mycena epipterygia]
MERPLVLGTRFIVARPSPEYFRSPSSPLRLRAKCNTSLDLKNREQLKYLSRVRPPRTSDYQGSTTRDPATHDDIFVFKRIPPENMCFVPAPVELETSEARALWGFAIAAVRQGVRTRDRWAWSFFKEWRDNRRRFLELYIRSGSGTNRFVPRLTNLEEEDFARVKKSLTTQDNRFYHSLGEQQIRAMTDHGEYCRSCEARIGGARITCFECQGFTVDERDLDTVDFCELSECNKKRVNRNDMEKPHLPHHDLMKSARTFFKSSAEGAAAVTLADDSQSEVGMEDEEGHAPISAKHMSRIPTLAVSIPKTLAKSTRLGPPDVCGVTLNAPPGLGCKQSLVLRVHQAGDSTMLVLHALRWGLFYLLGLVQESVGEKDLSIEERLTELDARFGRLEAAVEGRMVTMEKLLEQVLTRLS